MTKEYRAVLVDPGKPKPERPIQILTNSLHDVESWVIETLGGGTQLQGPAKVSISDQAQVEVYVTVERLETAYTVVQAKAMKRQILRRQEAPHATED